MVDNIIISINVLSYKMPDLTNINKAIFTITISPRNLNNIYYPYWKAFIRFYLKEWDLRDILNDWMMKPIDKITLKKVKSKILKGNMDYSKFNW